MTDRLDDLDEEMETLGDRLGETRAAGAAFSAELARLQGEMGRSARDLGRLSRGFSGGLRRAVDGLLFDGARLSDTFRTLALSMADTAYSAAMRPVTDHAGGLLSSGINAAVGAMLPRPGGLARSVAPFAEGLAAPPAAAPPAPATDGGGAGQGVHVTMNIATPDVRGFEQSRGQIAARLGRALAAGQRNR
ncbi:putative phage tail minor protein [Oceanicola granulosus HTCC2516]|uniref:Putative phage tail minor protein n=1 Tax=Oceanicola granulosus (strain ATCC BAA-861 / DSM 15982 / KCTC 12143 / HTCC2516) TaxID=314256 RepID=Q2CEC1_OCEGH|nr:hypothetical protein [Oceanicola granulosus]EAR51076.1 putative phage tail minor protein [Oceanicola granulosus HTCC2516]